MTFAYISLFRMFIRNTGKTNNFRIIRYSTRLFACFRRFLLKNDLFYNQPQHFLTFWNSLHKVMLQRQLKNTPYIFFNEPTNRQHITDNLFSCSVLFRLCVISAYICFNIFLSLKTDFTAAGILTLRKYLSFSFLKWKILTRLGGQGIPSLLVLCI